MKRWGWGILLLLIMTAGGTCCGLASEAPVTILFSHDLHDNLLPFQVENGSGVEERGGYARLQTAISLERQTDPELLLLDGGDFSMGTLFQTIFAREAPSLRLLGQMGYDAATLGNHEFDFRPAGLAASLTAAKASGDRLPQLVISNLAYPVDGEGRITGRDEQKLQHAMADYGVKPYCVLERKGYRIGLFGLMGRDAASNAPMAGVEFTDPVEQARRMVEILESREKADLIICLSHSGTVTDLDQSEDVILADQVPEIDVIISGHSHTRLDQPIVKGDTLICSTGEYGQNLGKLVLQRDAEGKWSQQAYRLIPMDSRWPADGEVSRQIDAYQGMVQKSYLDPMGMDFHGRLAHAPFSFGPVSNLAHRHAEEPLGNLISDAYIYAVKQAEGLKYEPVDVAIVPNGTVRASIVKGDVTVSDAFNVSSLGIGPDQKSGYPLLSVYLTGRELKTACEVDASITPVMKAAQLYMAGISYTFNPHRLMFNKVTEAALVKPDGTREEIEDDRLYRVVAGLYSAQMLSIVGEKSFGLLSVVPKTKDGRPVTDFEAQIVRRANGSEVKEWAALAQYLQSFAPVNGVPQIPDHYRKPQGRKIVDNNASLRAVWAHPNRIALTAYGLVIFVILLLALSVRVILRRRAAGKPAQPI